MATTKKSASKHTAASGKASSKSSAHASAQGAEHKKGGNSGSTSHSSHTTTDHEEIREWAEERGGVPSCVRKTGGKGDIGLLRLEFPGAPGAKDDNLEEITWDEFFAKFDESGLALVYQETTASGEKSNFNKLVSRESAAPKKKAAG